MEVTPEFLKAALKVLLAIEVTGSHPEYHRQVMAKHRREWPTMWNALDELREAVKTG